MNCCRNGLRFLAPVCGLFLLSCASGTDTGTGFPEQNVFYDKDQKEAYFPAVYGRSVVHSWKVIDDKTLLITTYDGKQYVATFATRCPRLRTAFQIGFVNRGPFALDRSSKVVFPDGVRCNFYSLKPFVPLETATNPREIEASEINE